MRQVVMSGLALCAIFAVVGPASGQQILDSSNTKFNSILSSLEWPKARGAGYSRVRQEPAAQETPAVDNAPSPADQVQPVPAEAAPQAAADCGGTITPGSYFDGNACGQACCDANWVVGVNLLVFDRDYEDDVGLSAVPSNLSLNLSSTSAEFETLGGAEVIISRRDCNGCGFELGFWGLYPDSEWARLDGSPYTNLSGLAQVDFGVPVTQLYNSSTYHRIERDNTINNLELNFLRCIGSTDCGQRQWEYLVGFRYFSFDEDFRYATFPTTPAALYYDTEVENDLYGIQFGVRSERCWHGRWGTEFGTSVGVYGNHLEAAQSIHDDLPAYAEIASGPSAGTDYNFASSKDDVSMIGELSFGLTYQIHCDWRTVGGYRILGISGVGLAPEQIPNNFTDVQDINRIKSDGSLILHGLYFGLEHSF